MSIRRLFVLVSLLSSANLFAGPPIPGSVTGPVPVPVPIPTTQPPTPRRPVLPDPDLIRQDPFKVTWQGRCGEDDLRAGRDTMEEMQRLIREANERSAQLAREAATASCREGTEAVAEAAARRLAAEANERACREVAEAGNRSLLKWILKGCGFAAVAATCAPAIAVDAAFECATTHTPMGDAEWPPRNSCQGLEEQLTRILRAEMELRERVSAATRDREMAAMTIARLNMMSTLNTLQELELRSARVSLESAERRLEDLLEEVNQMQNDGGRKASIVAQLTRCHGGLYPEAE